MTLILAVAVAFGVSACASAQPEKGSPCYAFVRRQSLLVSCGGPAREVLVLPDPLRIGSFAVARDGSAFGYAVLHWKWVNPRKSLGYLRLHLVPLQASGNERTSTDWSGQDLYASCGTILASTKSRVRDFIRGKRLKIKPYVGFRCSTDGKTIAGWTRASALEVGLPPRRQLIVGSRVYFRLAYDVSPNGRYVAYEEERPRVCVDDRVRGSTSCGACPSRDCDSVGRFEVSDAGKVIFNRHPDWSSSPKSASPSGRYAVHLDLHPRVCVFDLTSSRTFCGADGVMSPVGRLSVSDTGAVIFDRSLGKGSVESGVVMWLPGAHSSTVLQTAGGSPQWLTPSAAATLLDWAKHNQADVK